MFSLTSFIILLGSFTNLPPDRVFNECFSLAMYSDVKQKNKQRRVQACKFSYLQVFKKHFPFQ